MLRDLAVLTALQNRNGNEFQVRQRIRQLFYSETSHFRFIKTRPVGNQQGKPARLLRCENCLDTGTEAWQASEVNQPVQTQQGGPDAARKERGPRNVRTSTRFRSCETAFHSKYRVNCCPLATRGPFPPDVLFLTF